MNEKEKKVYEKPVVTEELDLETKAGSPGCKQYEGDTDLPFIPPCP